MRYVGRNGPRHRVSAELAKKNPVTLAWYVHAVMHTKLYRMTHTYFTLIHTHRNYDAAGLLQHDSGKFTDSEVFIVYEDKDEHLHAETLKNGQLPMRMTINAAAEQVSTKLLFMFTYIDISVHVHTKFHMYVYAVWKVQARSHSSTKGLRYFHQRRRRTGPKVPQCTSLHAPRFTR